MNTAANESGSTDNIFKFDLRHYGRVLMLHRYSIVIIAMGAALVTASVVFSIQPVYRASSTVLVENQQARVLSLEGVYSVTTSNKEYFLTQFELLKSRDLADQVVRRLQLDNHPLFDVNQQKGMLNIPALLDKSSSVPPSKKLTAQQLHAAVVDKFIAGLNIVPIRNTQLVKINYESTDPVLAATIANTMAELFIDSHIDTSFKLTRQATAWLEKRLDDLQDNVKAAEKRLQLFNDKAAKEVVTMQVGLEVIEELGQQYDAAKNSRIQADTIYQQVQQAGPKATAAQLASLASIYSLPQVQQLIESLANAQRAQSDAITHNNSASPKVLVATADLHAAQAALDAEVMNVAQNSAITYQQALDIEHALEAKLSAAKGEGQSPSMREKQRLSLQREVETNRHLYTIFSTRAKETDETGCLQSARVMVQDPAAVPNVPVRPQRQLAIVLALIAGGMFGVVLAFLRDALNNTIRTRADVEEKLNVPLLGILPLVKQREINKKMVAHQTVTSTGIINFSTAPTDFVKAIDAIRTSFVHSVTESPRKITLVTSTRAGEGKSTLALNIAAALGQLERVLLIDANMDYAAPNNFGLDTKAPGFAQLVAGTDLQACIQKSTIAKIDMLAAGVISGKPLDLLSSKSFANVLHQLSNEYDRVIIDASALHNQSDAQVLAAIADSVIYLVQADSTPVTEAAQAIKDLQQVGANIVGVVLNKMDTNKARYY